AFAAADVQYGTDRPLQVILGGGHGQRHLARQPLRAADAAAAVPAVEVCLVVLLFHRHRPLDPSSIVGARGALLRLGYAMLWGGPSESRNVRLDQNLPLAVRVRLGGGGLLPAADPRQPGRGRRIGRGARPADADGT